MIHFNHRSPVLIVWSLIFFFIAAIAVALRVTSTHIRRQALKIHDYLVFFSLVGLTRRRPLLPADDNGSCY